MWALIFGLFGIAAQPTAADTLINPSKTNRLVTINRVLIIGNKITKEKIISRELDLKPGDTISTVRLENVLQQNQRKIYNLRLFLMNTTLNGLLEGRPIISELKNLPDRMSAPVRATTITIRSNT